jgi:hypothetical protein
MYGKVHANMASDEGILVHFAADKKNPDGHTNLELGRYAAVIC